MRRAAVQRAGCSALDITTSLSIILRFDACRLRNAKMIVDGSTLPVGSGKEHDLCVVGSGVAGMLLVMELAQTYRDICVIESGAWKPDEDTQSLYELNSVGYPIRKNYQSRIRYFGGSCNIWAGRAMIYNEIDLMPRPWLNNISWPIDFAELDRYYASAARYLNLPSYEKLKPETWQSKLSNFEMSLFRNDDFKTNVSLFARAPARFGYKTKYFAKVRNSANITLYINSNAINLHLNDSLSQVERIDVACLNGVRYTINPRKVVLACGGLENTRILLASNKQMSSGIGNRNGLLGRFYMDHPRAVFGHLKLTKKIKLDHLLGMPVTGGKMQLGIALGDKIQSREGLLNNYLTLEPRYSIGSMELYESFVKLMKRLLRKGYSGKRFDFKNQEMAEVPEMIYLLTPKELLPHFMYYTYYKYSRIAKSLFTNLTHLSIVNYSEQEPNIASRVYLDDEKDKLGMPKLVLDWKISDRSFNSSLRLMHLLDEHFKRYEVGHIEQDLAEIKELPYTDASHHLGTTRMSADQHTGVVDTDCRVHGVKNLYVAGSSVFPTAGHANPTLTIAAMSLRLADYLKRLAMPSCEPWK
jgi:choline dehydrogenase-like flavoprotein